MLEEDKDKVVENLFATQARGHEFRSPEFMQKVRRVVYSRTPGSVEADSRGSLLLTDQPQVQ